MAMIVRENDVDVDAIKATLPESDRREALTHLCIARSILEPLRKGMPDATSPEILRALAIVTHALGDSLL